MSRVGRVLLNLSELRRVPVDPTEICFLETVGDHTLVRGFVRVHRNHARNLARTHWDRCLRMAPRNTPLPSQTPRPDCSPPGEPTVQTFLVPRR